MQVAADAVVFLTGMPIAGGLILDGLSTRRTRDWRWRRTRALAPGAPSVLVSVRARLRARAVDHRHVID